MKCLRLSVCVFFVFVSLAAFTGCPAAGPAPGETKVFDGFEFVWIPAGAFTMGSPVSEVDRNSDETQHQVKISHGFWLGKHEVTQAQWTAVMGSNPSDFDTLGAIKPVETVSWDDVQFFLAALNASKDGDGGPYRLPTESEWEYAYRAKTTTRFYWGNDLAESDIDDNAWYTSNSGSGTHNVGQKLPNAWELYDMAGNVYEWCQDWYGDYPTGPVTDPQGPDSGSFRVLRGGALNSDPSLCRAALRLSLYTPSARQDIFGFRLARTAD